MRSVSSSRFGVFVIPLIVSACNPNQSGHVAAQGTGDLSYGQPDFQPFDSALQEACGSGQPTVLGEQELGRWPYLQSVTGESAQLLWTSADAASLDIAPAAEAFAADHGAIEAARVDASAAPAVGEQWIADASGLSPATIYCYRIEGSDGAPWTDWTGFQTPPGAGQPVELTALGDLGESSADQFALLDTLENLPSQLVLITGDVAYPSGSLQSFEDHFFGVYRDMLGEVPFFPVSGNHDYKTAQGDAFRQVFSLPASGGPDANENWYSFDWGDVHIVALDTEQVGAVQAAWLEQDLAAHADATWTLVMLHKPPYSSGTHGDNSSVKKWFVPIFARAGVDLVLAGHDHDYERFLPKDGVVYVVTGGGGMGTRPLAPGPDTAYAEDVIHVVHLRITPSALTGWAVDATGQVFDTFQLTK